MPVDKPTLFESTKALWPIRVNVSRDPDAINDIYWRNEATFSKNDNWRQLALWSFHQALAGLEKHAIAKGFTIISPHEITFSEFDFWMRADLNGDDCWLEERAEYENGDAYL